MMLLLPYDSWTAVALSDEPVGWGPGEAFGEEAAAPVSDGKSDSECCFASLFLKKILSKHSIHTQCLCMYAVEHVRIYINFHPFAYTISMRKVFATAW